MQRSSRCTVQRRWRFFLLAVVASSGVLAEAAPLYEAEFIFPASEDPQMHVHASSLIVCPNGDLRAVWYENGPALPTPPHYTGDRDKSDDVRIGGSRKAAGADDWERPFVMSDTFGVSDNNPTLGIDADGRLWLVHSTMLGAPQWSWGSSIVRYHISDDYDAAGAPNWTDGGLLIPAPRGFEEIVERSIARRLSPEAATRRGITSEQAEALAERYREFARTPIRLRLGWMPRVHPLVRSDGALIVPLSNENFEIPMMAITSDGGKSWEYSNPVPESGLIQPSLAQFDDGTIVAFFRNGDPAHRVKRSESTDGGMTWSQPELTDRLHPGGGIEALVLANGHLALVYNNKETKPRDKLAVSISTDRGRTWQWTRQLEDEPGGRFDYPSIVQAEDGSLHVCYSYQLKTIKHVRFNEEWVQESDDAAGQ